MSNVNTSLDELKEAIGRIPTKLADAASDQGGFGYQYYRAEAWRTAFEWMRSIAERFSEEVHAYTPDEVPIVSERDEGMRLIREKLQS